MSEDLYGQAGQEADAGYTALPEPKPREEETFSSEEEGIRAAAKALQDERQLSEEREPVDRSLAEDQGRGRKVDDRYTVPAARAAEMLNTVREAEAIGDQQALTEQLADAVDRVRMEAAGIDPDAKFHTQQAQPEPQPQPDPGPPLPPGVDPEIFEAINKSPKLKAALQAEVAEIERAKIAYVKATDDSVRMAGAAFSQNFPELAGLTPEQLPVAVAMIQKTNPQRGEQIIRAAQGLQSLYEKSQAVQRYQQEQQRQVQAKQFAQYAEQNDKAFDEAIKNEPPETIKEVQKEILNIARDAYGIDSKTMAELWRTSPIMRSAQMQRVFYDAAKYHLAVKGAKANPASRNALPPVQRPGVSRPSAGDDDLRGLEDKFNRTGDVKSAAKLLLARRARG